MSTATESLAAAALLPLYRAATATVRSLCRAGAALAPEGEGRRRLAELGGAWSMNEVGQPPLWIHAASVGEVVQAAAVRDALLAEGVDLGTLLTVNTPTGRAVAAERGFDPVRYFPVDANATLRPLLSAWSAGRLLVFVETELWPNTLAAAAERGLPVAFVGATLSERSASRYRRLRAALGPVLRRSVVAVSARDQEAAERWRSIGVPEAVVHVDGDLKYDLVPPPEVWNSKPFFDDQRPFLVAASTHQGEDAQVLDALASLSGAGLRCRLLLAPRHPERAPELSQLARARSFRVALRSEGPPGDCDVYVLDTVGELAGAMGGAAAVFVGGSLVDVGGHNLLEAAAAGVVVSAGPSLDSVADAAALLDAAGALDVVDDSAALAACWRRILEDPATAAARGAGGRRAVEEQRGASAKIARRLVEVLSR